MIEIVGAGLVGMLLGCLIEKHKVELKSNVEYRIFEKGSKKGDVKRMLTSNYLYKNEKHFLGLGGNLNIWGGVVGLYSPKDFLEKNEFEIYLNYMKKGLRVLGLDESEFGSLNDLDYIYQYAAPPTALELLEQEFGTRIVNEMLSRIEFTSEVDLNSEPKIDDLRLICCGAINYWLSNATSKCIDSMSDTFFHPALRRGTKENSRPFGSRKGRFRFAPLSLDGEAIKERQIPVNGGFFAYIITRSAVMKFPYLRQALLKLSVVLNIPFSKSKYYVPIRREKVINPDSRILEFPVHSKHPGLHFAGATNQTRENYQDRSCSNLYWITPAVSSFIGVTPTTLFAVCQALHVFDVIQSEGYLQ